MHTAESNRPTDESNMSYDEYDRPANYRNWSLDETNRIMRIESNMNHTTTVLDKGEMFMVNSFMGILRENLRRKDRLEIKKKEILQE